MAHRRNLPLLTLEDSFLRSVRPGQGAPAGVVLDWGGVHYDAASGSDLIGLLNAVPVPDADTIAARALIQHHRLSKYNDWADDVAALPARFVLLVDQIAGDSALMGAGPDAFARILDHARACTDLPILIRPHPAGQGLFARADLPSGVAIMPTGVNPWDIWPRVAQVHVHSSQLGFEAILAGLTPVVHGQPIYAGWGLSEDVTSPSGRTATLTADQLFAGLMRDGSLWPDPATGQEGGGLRAVQRLASTSAAHHRTRGRAVLHNVSNWKRQRVLAFLGQSGAQVQTAWGHAPGADARIEDGFLRSRGLGARLVPPVSLIHDRRGIHFDPTRPSEVEAFITASLDLPPAALERAARLRTRLLAGGFTKYNLSGPLPDLPAGLKILVAGQVPDDASVRIGGAALGDGALITAARAAHPDASILYKPHPDIVAGLRSGVPATGADLTLLEGNMATLLPLIDGLWTDTSLSGFEALLRGVPVTCTGWPFYAGWGLTTDLGAAPSGLHMRRHVRPSLDQLTHAALIDYPLYLDPRTQARCGPEDVLDWLDSGGQEPAIPLAGAGRLLSRLLRYATRT